MEVDNIERGYILSEINVFNKNTTAHKTGKYPIFGGEEPALYDSINQPYPKFFDLMEQLKQIDWNQDDIDLTETRMDLLRCPKELRELMLFNLAYQWSLDSIATSIPTLLAPFVTNSEYGHAISRIGENECLTPDAEVLTTSGWKLLKDIIKGEEIYTYDTKDKKLKLDKVLNTIKKPYKGDIYKFSCSSFSQKVTENHRMLVESYYTGTQRFALAKDLHLHGGNRVILSGEVESIDDRELSFEEKLAVMYQADGSWDKKYTGAKTGVIPIKVSVSKEEKKKFLEDLKIEAEGKGYRVKDLNTAREDYLERIFYVPVKFSKLYDKSFSWVTFDKGIIWVNSFLEEVKKWDSWTKGSHGWRYINTNAKAVTVVETLVSLSGKSSSTSWSEQKGKGTLDHAQVYIKDRNYQAGNSVKLDKASYDGDVYCVTVPSGAFLVKQDGKISVTGNCLHSVTYSNIVRQCVPDPQEVFDMVYEHEEVLERSAIIGEVLGTLKKRGAEFTLGIKTFEECKTAVIEGLVAIYALERISFMSSFACTFALAEQEYFVGGARLVQKILQDEMIHFETQRYALEILQEDENFKEVFANNKQRHSDIINGVVNQETCWNKYLFSGGRSLVGLNEGLLNDWTRYNAQEVCDNLNLKPNFRVTKTCPLPWFEADWMEINNHQNANMESDATNYSVNAISREVSGESLLAIGLSFEDEEDTTLDFGGDLTVYSREDCPFCDRLKGFLKVKEVPFKEVDVTQNVDSKEFLLGLGLKTVPQVFDVSNNYLGDCTTFIEKFS